MCARTGQNGIQRFFQPGCTVTVIAQIADQVLAQRRFQISPDRRITLCPLYRKILTYLQQKRCGAVAVPVQKSLPGAVGDAVEPGIVALTRKAERQITCLHSRKHSAPVIVKIAAAGRQRQLHFAL